MTIRKTTSAHTIGTPGFGSLLRTLISALPNPIVYMRAYQNMRRFRSMDVALLMDVGLTQADADRATFGDFLKQPNR